MSTRRFVVALAAFVALAALAAITAACAHDPSSSAPPPASPTTRVAVSEIPAPPISSARAAAAPASASAAPERLAVPPLPEGLRGVRESRFDADAGAFAAPAGAYVLVHTEDGDTQPSALSKRTAACVRERGAVYVRFAVEPRDGGPSDLRVVAQEGAAAAVACVMERMRSDRPWPKMLEPVVVEATVIVR